MPIIDITQYSLTAGETLSATAKRAEVWLLLEYNAVWGAKALPESDLTPEVKHFLEQQEKTIPNLRFQFIKRDAPSSGIMFYVARTGLVAPFLYRFRLGSYEDLLDINIADLVTARSEYTMSEERLFVVCTNGKRDAACAKYGLPLYNAMREAANGVWQTTHFGGHRFAATLACLPHGVMYGRVPLDMAQTVVESYQKNRVLLEYYRGCSAYDPPTQAAEDHLRTLTGETRLGGLRHHQTELIGEKQWAVMFQASSGEQYSLQVRALQSEFAVFEGTRDESPEPVMTYLVEMG
ncbi:MAG: sucrase ferredoxin [Anaerolineae bacterium]